MCMALSDMLPSTSSQAIFDPVTERQQEGKGLFSVLTIVITAEEAGNCSDSSACEVMSKNTVSGWGKGKSKAEGKQSLEKKSVNNEIVD